MQLSDNELFKKVITISHIPPFTEQFNSDMEQVYRLLMQENNVQLSIHGHIHRYSFGKVYNDSVNYLTVPWLKKPTYCIINVFDKAFNIEIVAL
jgi:UDP-2,3-diacylglucosamine pyrophosphatase LpxH